MNRAWTSLLVLTLAGLVMTSCDEQHADWGTTTRYPQFLWSEGSVTPITKTIDLEFSTDAKMNPSTGAVFQFTDNDGQPISPQEMLVVANGDTLRDNKFTAHSSDTCIELKISFTPEAKSGKHQGLLRVTGHALDRVDSQNLTPWQSVEVAQWTITYDKQMNPWSKQLLYAALGILLCLFVWRTMFCPHLFPRFKRCKKMLVMKQNGRSIKQMSIVFTGKRKVILTSRKQKQSFWNWLFTGKVQYIALPALASDLSLTPSTGRQQGISARGAGYSVQPFIIPRSGKGTITHPATGLEIQLL